MLSSFLEALFEEPLGRTSQLHGLGDCGRYFLLCVGDSRRMVRFSLCLHFGCLSHRLLDDFSLDELGLGNNAVVLKVRVSIDRIDLRLGLCGPFRLDTLGLGLDLGDFSLLLHLLELGALFLILALFFLDLPCFKLFFFVILNALFEGELFL